MNTYLFLIISALFFYGCCNSSQISENRKELNIQTDIQNLYSWLNLMPGTSDPSIHLTADIEIMNNEDFPLENILMDKIEIVNDNTVLELFASETTPDLDQLLMKEGETKSFNIKAHRDLKQKISFDGPVTVIFYMHSGSGIHKFEVKEVNIERVY